MDSNDISRAEGGGKRCKPSSLSPKSVESDQPNAGSNEAVVYGPGTTDAFPTLANRGGVNENGTADDIDWDAMGQEEVQDQQNDADKLDICPIYLLSCYWKSSNGKLMLSINGLNGISEDTVEADDVKIDYPYTLALYLIGTSIGVKKAWESRNFSVAKEWRDWAARFMNAKTRRIERLVMILGQQLYRGNLRISSNHVYVVTTKVSPTSPCETEET